MQDLLTIARLDAGTMAWEKRTFPVSWLMEQVGRRFAFQARQQEKNLSFSGGEEITLYGDPHWLNEAVSNLVKNALEHTRPGDAIHVSWSTFGSVVQIQVRDNGSGIHPEDLPYIFKRVLPEPLFPGHPRGGSGTASGQGHCGSPQRNH